MDRFGNQFPMTPQAAFTTTTVAGAERVTAFLRKVYGWMAVGLGITAAVAFGVAASGFGSTIAGSPALYWGLFLAPFALALFLQFRADRIQPGTASLLFVVYAALMGAWLSIIFFAFAAGAIASAFIVTAGMFGAAAVYGTVTRRSLAGVGQFFYMGFIGIFLALLVSLFWRGAAESAGFQFGISVIGVVVFTGLAAWKGQSLKQLASVVPEERLGSYAIVGALQLYITFINLFLMLLRLFGGGGRRN
jgi:FtsH-binding integral membrane protein